MFRTFWMPCIYEEAEAFSAGVSCQHTYKHCCMKWELPMGLEANSNKSF